MGDGRRGGDEDPFRRAWHRASNGGQTNFEFEGTLFSGLDKLKQTVRAFGKTVASTANYSYSNLLPAIEVTVKSDLRTEADNLLEKTTVFDGFGRAVRRSWRHLFRNACRRASRSRLSALNERVSHIS